MPALKRNNVHVRGTGDRVIVFVNGFGCTQDVWRRIAPAFERDFVTVLFDQVGAGHSLLSAYSTGKYSSLAAYSEDLLEIGNSLNLQHAVIVGHSCGAMIAALACLSAPEMFDQLVMICPSARYINDDDYVGGFSAGQVEDMLRSLKSDWPAWSLRMAPLFLGNNERPDLVSELTMGWSRHDPIVAEDFAGVVFRSDMRDSLPKLTTRSLILQSREDCLAPLSAGQYINAHLPRSELVLMNARGHFPHVSDPLETVGAIHTFLSGKEGKAQGTTGFLRQGVLGTATQILGIPHGKRGEEEDPSGSVEEALESLLARHGELWMHIGRYDMYALALQQVLATRFGGELERFDVRSRGEHIESMLVMISPELHSHFRETHSELKNLLDRHRVSAARAAPIAGLARTLGRFRNINQTKPRDWFDQGIAQSADYAAHLSVVERDILKMVSLCFRIAHCALGVQKSMHLGSSVADQDWRQPHDAPLRAKEE